MLIKKGTIIKVRHNRKGTFLAIVTTDFDTENIDFYPIKLTKNEYVKGSSEDWKGGDEIPCRRQFCTIEIVNKES
jgi:hypothetical protein